MVNWPDPAWHRGDPPDPPVHQQMADIVDVGVLSHADHRGCHHISGHLPGASKQVVLADQAHHAAGSVPYRAGADPVLPQHSGYLADGGVRGYRDHWCGHNLGHPHRDTPPLAPPVAPGRSAAPQPVAPPIAIVCPPAEVSAPDLSARPASPVIPGQDAPGCAAFRLPQPSISDCKEFASLPGDTGHLGTLFPVPLSGTRTCTFGIPSAG